MKRMKFDPQDPYFGQDENNNLLPPIPAERPVPISKLYESSFRMSADFAGRHDGSDYFYATPRR